jgi:hypothetical protein
LLCNGVLTNNSLDLPLEALTKNNAPIYILELGDMSLRHRREVERQNSNSSVNSCEELYMKKAVPISHPTKSTPGMHATRTPGAPVESPSALIDDKIKQLGDWRGKTLAKVREIIHAADPEIVEEWKWAKATSPGVPVWSHGGIVCTGEASEHPHSSQKRP